MPNYEPRPHLCGLENGVYFGGVCLGQEGVRLAQKLLNVILAGNSRVYIVTKFERRHITTMHHIAAQQNKTMYEQMHLRK